MVIEKIREWLGLEDEASRYVLLMTSPRKRRVETFDRALDPEVVEFEAELQPGKYRLQELTGSGRFGESIWTYEVEGEIVDDDEDDRLDRLEAAVLELAESGGAGGEDFDEQLKRGTFAAVLNGELTLGEGKGIADLAAAFDGGAGPDIEPDMNFKIESMSDFLGWRAMTDTRGVLEDLEAGGSQLSKSLGRSFVEGVAEAQGGAGGADRGEVDVDQEAGGLDGLRSQVSDAAQEDVDEPDDHGPAFDDDAGQEADEPPVSGADFDVIGADEEADQEPEEAGAVAVCDGCGRRFEGDDMEHARRRLNGHKSGCNGAEAGLEDTARRLQNEAEESGPLDAEDAVQELSEAEEREEADS